MHTRVAVSESMHGDRLFNFRQGRRWRQSVAADSRTITGLIKLVTEYEGKPALPTLRFLNP